MFLLAYVPPLWRKVMDPKVLAWADGDMSRVNVDPAWRASSDDRRPQSI